MKAHLDTSKLMCLFTKASEAHFAEVLTQAPPEDFKQVHEPLSFCPGSSKGALRNLSTFENEAYVVIEAMERLDYLTLTGEVRVYTDHLTLLHVHEPRSFLPTKARHVFGKLQRCGMRQANFE